MRGHHMTSHDIAVHHVTSHNTRNRITSNAITSHPITWHDILQLTTLPHPTSPHNQPHYFISPCNHIKTGHHITAWNGWRLIHSKNSVWASQWLVTLCTFYRQILSLAYSFFLLKLPPPACPALLVYMFFLVLPAISIQYTEKYVNYQVLSCSTSGPCIIHFFQRYAPGRRSYGEDGPVIKWSSSWRRCWCIFNWLRGFILGVFGWDSEWFLSIIGMVP